MWKLNSHPATQLPEDSVSEGQLSEDFTENAGEQDLEDRASEASDSQRTTLEDVDYKDTDDDGQELEGEEAEVIN